MGSLSTMVVGSLVIEPCRIYRYGSRHQHDQRR